jgi:chemotaxis protein methyltransferase CheR
MNQVMSITGTATTDARATTAATRVAGILPADFTFIADLVKARSGIILGTDKAYLVEARLEQVVRKAGLSNLADLTAKLRAQPTGALSRSVVDAMTTNESLFFRDSKPFDHLRGEVLPKLHKMHPAGRPLRIWSAAASSGQEPYSIAITVAEAALAGRRVEIIGTDISTEQIARAKEGLYTQFEAQRGLPIQSLMKHFAKEGTGWRVAPAIRKLVEFREWNLLDDMRPLGTFDIVFCRNVLIYFDPVTKKKVLDAIWARLDPSGYLYLGGAETTLGVTDLFVACPNARQVYLPVRQ